MAMCPICGALAKRLDRTGDAEGFDCPRHGKFKVAGTVMATEQKANPRWDAALGRAKERTDPGALPCIISSDF